MLVLHYVPSIYILATNKRFYYLIGYRSFGGARPFQEQQELVSSCDDTIQAASPHILTTYLFFSPSFLSFFLFFSLSISNGLGLNTLLYTSIILAVI